MKRLNIIFAIVLIAGTATLATAADTDPGVGASDMQHTYKADLSGMKMPPVVTRATGEATFQLVKPGMGGTGGTGMSSTGTSIPGDDTGMSGPGQGYGQNQPGTNDSYAGIDKSREVPGSTVPESVPGSVPGAGTGGTMSMGDSLQYTLTVKDLKDVTAAHLHMGKSADGPVIAPLFLGPMKKGQFSGTLAQGSITDKDLKGPLAGKTVDDLASLIASGEVFVNVHTSAHPKGEISGIVKEVS